MKVSGCRKKKNERKINGFHKTKSPSQPYRMKSWFKNTFPLYKKYLSQTTVSEKIEKNKLPLAKKSVSMGRNKVFL